jgi:N6-L-threonylcarbamoyladenine synthase
MTDPLILAIDTSCDDTSAAITQGVTVFSNIIASQTQLHEPYGGVFPTVAKQAHKENIDRVVEKALRRAGIELKGLDAVAVTQGPGLAPALEVGITKAKELATQLNIPLVPVNHIEAHALSSLVQPKRKQNQPFVSLDQSMTEHTFPILSLIVSGGHTEFILITAIGEYERLGFTIDDAAGEALDKVGRMLDLGYPAGSVIEEMASKGDPKRFAFPLPMTTQHDFNLSFSGMKTFSRNLIEELEAQQALDKQAIYDFCASFQYAVFRHIMYKLNKILPSHNIHEVWLGGGVAANTTLRQTIRETLRAYSTTSHHPKLTLHVPYTKRLCMDNAAMIGVTAGFQFLMGKYTQDILSIERKPRWSISSLTV